MPSCSRFAEAWSRRPERNFQKPSFAFNSVTEHDPILPVHVVYVPNALHFRASAAHESGLARMRDVADSCTLIDRGSLVPRRSILEE
jgi:hypothetical protein